MNAKPISIRDIDINNVTFSVKPASKVGRSPSFEIKYNGQPLNLRIPRTKYPGGLLIREDDKTGVMSYTLIGTMTGCDTYAKELSTSTDDMSLFYNFMYNLENKIIAFATENSVKLFGKKKTEEVVRDNFKRPIRISSTKVEGEYVPNGKYPPSFQVKIPVYDNKVSMNVWDDSKNEIYVTPDSLASVFPKHVEAVNVVIPSGYVMNGTSFGITFRATNSQVYQKARLNVQDIFGDEDQEEEQTHVQVSAQDMEDEVLPVPVQQEESEGVPVPDAPRKGRRAVKSSM